MKANKKLTLDFDKHVQHGVCTEANSPNQYVRSPKNKEETLKVKLDQEI